MKNKPSLILILKRSAMEISKEKKVSSSSSLEEHLQTIFIRDFSLVQNNPAPNTLPINRPSKPRDDSRASPPIVNLLV